MAVHLVSYASPGYYEAQKILGRSALENGVDYLLPRGREDVLRSNFYEKHKSLLDRPRYSGSCVWKPWIILDTLKKLPDGDMLIYTDCTFEFTGSLSPILDICKTINSPMIFGDCRIMKAEEHAKRDAFVILGCDEPRFWNAPCVWAGINIWKPNELNLTFLEEWLGCCVNPDAVLDKPNVMGLPDRTGFYHHGLDNALMNILAAKYDLELFRCPHESCNFAKLPQFRQPGENLHGKSDYDCSRFPNSPYPSVIRHNAASKKRYVTLHEAIGIGLQHHRHGLLFDLFEARQVYEQVLAIDPEHEDALYLLALVELQLSGVQNTLVKFHKHGLEAARKMVAKVVGRRPGLERATRCLELIETRLEASEDSNIGLPDEKYLKKLLDIKNYHKYQILVD